MKRSYKLTVQAILMIAALGIAILCVAGIRDVLLNGAYNPGRPGFHVTAIIAYALWIPVPLILLGIYFKRLVCGLYMLLPSVYLATYIVFWDVVLPTPFALLTDSVASLTIIPTMILVLFLAGLAVRYTVPKSKLATHLRSYPSILLFVLVTGVLSFLTLGFLAGEEMRVANAIYVARSHVYYKEYEAALEVIDTAIDRYQGLPPNRHRVDALVFRARLFRNMKDDEGYERTIGKIEDITKSNEELAAYYQWRVERLNERGQQKQ